MCRDLLYNCCVFWREQNHEEYELQSGKNLHSWGGVVTDGIKAVPIKEVDCREAHGDVLIRSNLCNTPTQFYN